MTLDEALAEIRVKSNAEKPAKMLAYHKVDRPYLGTVNTEINDLTKAWREELTLDARLILCHDLWQTNIHEARIAAAKLLTQARIRPDDKAAWELIKSWVPEFDAWAIADHASTAGQKRLVADPARIDEIEEWTTSDHLWTKRAALVMTLPWTKQNFPKSHDLEIRDRVLGWAASYVEDKEWFIQKAVSWWLRDLSKHDPDRTRAFLVAHGDHMAPFARKDAARLLTA